MSKTFLLYAVGALVIFALVKLTNATTSSASGANAQGVGPQPSSAGGGTGK